MSIYGIGFRVLTGNWYQFARFFLVKFKSSLITIKKLLNFSFFAIPYILAIQLGNLSDRRVARLGDLSPPFTQKFFNLLGVLRKKPEDPSSPKFFHTKILKISLKKFLATPLLRDNTRLNFYDRNYCISNI